MLKLKIIYIVGMFICTTSLFGQKQKSVIVYTDDTPYLIPYIEKYLMGLRDKKNDSIFNQVVNLTRIIENERDEQSTSDTRIDLTKGKILSLNLPDSIKSKVSIRMNKFDLFLKININSIQDLLEYQFILYKIVKLKPGEIEKSSFLQKVVNDVEVPLGVENIIIDPRKKDYLEKVENAIRRMFLETDYPPIARVYANGKLLDGSTLFCAVGDTLFLDATYSSDNERPLVDLSFYWLQIGPKVNGAIPYSFQLPIDQGNSKQKFVFSNTGLFIVTLLVNDGVQNSDTLNILINSIRNPILNLSTSYIEINNFRSIFSRLNKKDNESNIEISLVGRCKDILGRRSTMIEINKKINESKSLPNNINIETYDFARINKAVIDISTMKVDTLFNIRFLFGGQYKNRTSKYTTEFFTDYHDVRSNKQALTIDYFKFNSNFRLTTQFSYLIYASNRKKNDTTYVRNILNSYFKAEDVKHSKEMVSLFSVPVFSEVNFFVLPRLSLGLLFPVFSKVDFVGSGVIRLKELPNNDTLSYLYYAKHWGLNDNFKLIVKMGYTIGGRKFESSRTLITFSLSLFPLSLKEIGLTNNKIATFKNQINPIQYESLESVLAIEEKQISKKQIDKLLYNPSIECQIRLLKRPLLYLNYAQNGYFFKITTATSGMSIGATLWLF